MSRDADTKRDLLTGWLADFLPTHAVRLFGRGEMFTPAAALSRLAGLSPEPSVYVLLAASGEGIAPVYIGKAGDPAARWAQHVEHWSMGAESYARWRAALLDEDGRARADLTLLVAPVAAMTRPPIPGFPVSAGSVEYQLIGLAEDAYPGRLLNAEGRGRC